MSITLADLHDGFSRRHDRHRVAAVHALRAIIGTAQEQVDKLVSDQGYYTVGALERAMTPTHG